MPELITPVIPPQSQEGMPFPEEQVLLAEPPVVEDPPESTTELDRLSAYLEATNIANNIDDEVLKKMGSKVVEDFTIDKDSRKEWEDMIENALELAKQVTTTKKVHGEAVANIKYPALATAAIQFQARALSNIIKGRDVVKGKVIGLATPPDLPEDFEAESEKDIEHAEEVLKLQALATNKWAKADRLGSFMSYQFLDEIDDWQDDLDQLLATLPVVGCCFKKTYYDSVGNKPQSPYVKAQDLVVNYYAKSFRTAPRVTHILEFNPNEIEERVRGEIFLDQNFGDPEVSETADSRDEDRPHKFLEQHTWWDLNDDGYKEPYVITVHKESEKVVRVVAGFDADGIIANEKGDIIKISQVQYFTRFLFMPAFDGNFYGMGFGSLMAPMNAIINDTANMILDAGRLAVSQGGFVGKGINLGKQGVLYVKPNEWISVTSTGDDLRKGIVPLPVKEPSPVLFQLLGLMLEASKEVSSVSDVLTGEQQGANASPTTTLALIEQGLKVFSSIYKRLHRSLKAEFEKVRRLNRLYLDPEHYKIVLDDPKADISDFAEKDIDVVPVSDETELTHVQKLIKAEALNAKKGTGLNDREIDKRYLEALDTPDIEKLLPPENAKPPEDPELEIKRQELDLKRQELENDAKRIETENRLADAKIEKMRADTDRSGASAQKTRSEAVNDEHMQKLDSLTKVVQMQNDAIGKLTDRILKDSEDKDDK